MFDRILGSGSVRRVAVGSIAALAIYIAGAGLTACSQLLIARIVGVDTFGVYAYVLAWVTVLAYFSALGFDIALVRFVPAYHADQAWAFLGGVIQYAERRVAAASACVIVVGATAILTSPWGMSPELKKTFLVGLVMVPVLALAWIRGSVVRAFGGVMSAIIPDRLVRDGALIAIIVFASWGLKWKIDAPLVMIATLASAAAALGLASVAMHRLHPREIDGIARDYEARIWRKTIVSLVAITGAEVLLNRSGVLILGWAGYTRDAGIYALVFSISLLVALPRTAVNTLLAPTISNLFVRERHDTMQLLAARSALWTLCAATGIALPLALLAEPLLTWFGPGYVAGAPALRILLIGQVIAASLGSQLSIMTMTGCERAAAFLVVVSAVFNLLAGALLVSWLGLTGAAVATTMTLIAWNAAMAVFIWLDLRLIPGPLAMIQSLHGIKGAARQYVDQARHRKTLC